MFLTGWKEPLENSIPMYNIFLSLNSSYVPYGKMFMKSLYDVVDMSRVDRVVIADTGLDLKDKQYFLASYDKVDILETNLISSFDQGGTWGKGWQSVVTSKAKYLLEALKKYDTTTVMVDGDCIFLKDISEIISDDDIQLCYRGDEKPDNPYLGSYTAFKPTEKRHPSKEGTYLAAAVVFGTLFKKQTEGNKAIMNLDQDVALKIQKIADKTVSEFFN